MRMTFFLIRLISSIVVLCSCIPAYAGPPTEQVRSMLETVMMIQTDPQLEAAQCREKRRESIKKVIADNFDFDAMAQDALGQHWEGLSSSQRSEFKSIFADLFQNSYTSLVLDFLKQEQIIYRKEDTDQISATVETTIARPNDEIPVDYFLAPRNEAWLVNDVAIDGVSIIDNYRKSFARVIQTDSYEGLLEKMKIQQKAIR